MIVPATKATQADFLRDFAVCSDDLTDESDASQTSTDEQDGESVGDHYRQSWKSLPRLDTAPGPPTGIGNHYALSCKSLPRTNHDQTQADEGGLSPKHWTVSQKKLPSSRSHIIRENGEEAVIAGRIDEESCQDSASAVTTGNPEGGPRKIFRHSAMTAEEQAHKAALLRGKIAEFDAAEAAGQESSPKHSVPVEPTHEQISIPPVHASKKARKKRKSRQIDNSIPNAEGFKAAKTKASRKKARKDVVSNAESPSQLSADMFLFSPLPVPVSRDEVARPNRKQGKQRKAKGKDKILHLKPELQILMAMLNQLGEELENALDDIVNDLVQLAGDVASVTDTMALVEGWKSNSRRQLIRLVKQLEHYGIVPMGGVQVPEGKTACKLSLSDSSRASSLLEDKLNHFSFPFEDALNRLAKQIQGRVKDEAAEQVAVERSTEILEQWVTENRLHFSRLVSILRRSNVVLANMVLIPTGEVNILEQKDCDTRKDSAVISKETEAAADLDAGASEAI